MELRQLKYFVKVAELLSFSKAAKALFITQSTLSQQIKQLEDELDMALFFRNNHKVSLTEAGETFLEGVRRRHLPRPMTTKRRSWTLHQDTEAF